MLKHRPTASLSVLLCGCLALAGLSAGGCFNATRPDYPGPQAVNNNTIVRPPAHRWSPSNADTGATAMPDSGK